MARFTAESNREMWEARWERMYEQGREDQLGPKGQAYIREQHGEEYEPDQPPYDDYNDYGDYEFDIEY